MNALWRICLLGGLRAEGLGREVTRFRTQKTAALLAYLAYYRDRSHPRDLLIEVLWPEDDLDAARNKLRLALSSLRRQLEPPGVPAGAVIVADRASVRLNSLAASTDVAEFEAALESAGCSESSRERALLLGQAVDLYHSDLLPGYHEEWVLPERQRLSEAYLQALHGLIAHLEQSRDLDRALNYAHRAVSADPLREESRRDLMRLLAAAGQPSAALQQYRELEHLLQQEYGEAPSVATRQLAAQWLAASDQDPAPPAAPPPRPNSQSPAPAAPTPASAPIGTVTFLLTDIESSTAHWQRAGEAFRTTLATHHALLRREFQCQAGYEVNEAGDSFLIAFSGARNALACAVAGQRALASQTWPPDVSAVRVRMALHTGDVDLEEDSYHDPALHHASRILMAAHGGQIVCSEVTAGLLRRGGEAKSGAMSRVETTEPPMRLVDLGIYRLRDIATSERLFQVEYPDMAPREFPPLKAEAGYAGNLPPQFTRFFGRETEIVRLQQMLLGRAIGITRSAGTRPAPVREEKPGFTDGRQPTADSPRLVTLTGPGGSGKTRLALETAMRLVELFRGAVWFVPLADLATSEQIGDAIREALRLPRSPGIEPLDQVVEALSRHPSLLVLDNFEHLVTEGAPLVRTLQERVPTARFLITSRERLGLEGEQEFEVFPLPTPPHPDVPERLTLYGSVQLFVDRAQAAQPDFQVTNASAAAVAELCHRLEGIPLALELAAAWAKVLTPAQMLAHLEHRLDFLVSRRRGAAARHRTLRTAIDWSYQLLSPELQRFFARLSVFRSGFTLRAAEAVCNGESDLGLTVLDGGASLVDKSLLRSAPGQERASEPRFVMLESIREYAQECLEARGEDRAIRRRYASYFHVTGGTLPLNTGSYVARQADIDLYEALNSRELCYVLTNRQMGKSSLMVRNAVRLRQEGAAVAVVDLTAIRGKLTAEEWHDALLRHLAGGLDLEDEWDSWESAHKGLAPRERWLTALQSVILRYRPGRIVIFIDEIDAVRALPFSLDELFAVIRECYDRRAEDAVFNRLTFCLLGVAAPADLIRDPHATPFDIGRRIVLKDFTEAEAAPLVHGLGRAEPLGAALLQRILYWTGGHPYLTQRLCRAVAEDASVAGLGGVDRLCEELFLSPRGRERDDNLLFVRDRLLRSNAEAPDSGRMSALLGTYAQLLAGQPVPIDATDPLVSLLRLSGIVRGVDGFLRVRNRIYERVFDQKWVQMHLTDPQR